MTLKLLKMPGLRMSCVYGVETLGPNLKIKDRHKGSETPEHKTWNPAWPSANLEPRQRARLLGPALDGTLFMCGGLVEMESARLDV